MALNFDTALNNARTVLRGEASGSVRFLAATMFMLAVWAGVVTVNDWNAQSITNLNSQQSRFRTLLILGNEYKSLAPQNPGNTNRNVDVPTVFAQVSEQMALGSRVNRISPDGRNQAVEINRLYAEEFTELQELLAARGVKFIAVEIRALPAGQERLFTISAIIGPVI